MELARRTGSEVVVLDAIQLAAGEWGAFGKGRHQSILPVWEILTLFKLVALSNFPETLYISLLGNLKM